ncbi:helix-turn-helix domain-containing protein [Enterococcus sp. UD-01]|jgi:uncharacterized protein YpbB|uniref:helix-turn-helix domain-containing protein n=1 Tax=Enterococcus sp. UD-01 TaxID=3373911 RepID=UPI003832383B
MKPYYILALFQHGYKARISTLYHLLKGKRTSSVLLYGFLYNNLNFFQLCPDLAQRQFDACIEELCREHLLEQDTQGHAVITDKGQKKFRQQMTFYPWLNNYLYGKTDENCWRLLQFSVQVVSHLSYADKNYSPLELSPFYQQQLKQAIRAFSKKELISACRYEWFTLFSLLSAEEADFLARQFSGYQFIGRTSFQVQSYQEDKFQAFLHRKAILHHLLYLIAEREDIKVLKCIIAPLLKQNENQSMNETKRYLNQQFSVAQIAEQRKIKKSTVQDHLIELALTTDFPFQQFISAETCRLLGHLSAPYQNWQYRSLKEQAPALDYFEFRLYQISKIKEEREKEK